MKYVNADAGSSKCISGRITKVYTGGISLCSGKE